VSSGRQVKLTNRDIGSEMKRTVVNPIFKDTITFLQTSAESNGRITDAEVTLMPKRRNVLHCHVYHEKFTAIDGELGLETEKKNKRY
jgi:hypothetical protein